MPLFKRSLSGFELMGRNRPSSLRRGARQFEALGSKAQLARLRHGLLLAAVLGVQACSFMPFGKDGSGGSASPPSSSTGSNPGSGGSTGPSNARMCVSELSAMGARFTTVPDSYGAPGCNQLGTVRLSSLAGDSSAFEMTNLGPVKCEVAKAFAGWARFGVDRAAQQILGSRLVRIETMGSYACRNIAGTNKRSSHSRAEAIDVSAFVLADGRRIVLKRDWDGGTRAEREFLRIVQASACKRFGTVLGPEYNAAHEDHFHLEGVGAKFCR